ncbi:MAG TPA: hypothetical protein VIF60_01275 [Burkholderiaceae bacterium]|jgi:hypothetical protein
MAVALKANFANLTNLKLNPNEIGDAVRESASRILETVQATFDKTQKEGRLALSKQVFKSAQRTNELSKALVILSAKIAPDVKAKAAPKKPAARKVVAKTAAKATAKPRARKAA